MNVKKLIALSTAGVFVASQVLTGIASATSTNYPAEWVEAVNFMKEYGLSSTANSVEQYEPLATVKREAAAKFFVNYAKKVFNKQADTTKTCAFDDISEAQTWAIPYIVEACQMGLLKGANGKFLPKQELTKFQFLTVLARLVKNDPSIEPMQAFDLMKQEGVTKEVSFQDTVRPLTRIELAILLKRATAKYATEEEEGEDVNIGDILGSILEDETEEGEEAAEEGEEVAEEEAQQDSQEEEEAEEAEDEVIEGLEDELVVSVNPDTQDSIIVSKTAKFVKILKVDFSAGSKDVTINNVVVKLNGLAERDDVDNVYFVNDEDIVVSTDKSISSDYTATVRFKKDNVVEAGTTKSYYLVVDFKADGTRNGYFTIEEVDASSDVNGLPVKSAYFNLVDYAGDKVVFGAK